MTDHKIESAAATGAEHVVSVAYVPNKAGTGAKLVMRVDGGDAQTKDITGLAYLNSSIKGKVGFGNEVHTDALSRGFVGSLSEIRLAETSANFTTNEFKLVYSQVSCDTSGIKEANTFDVKPAECEAALKTKLSSCVRPKSRPTTSTGVRSDSSITASTRTTTRSGVTVTRIPPHQPDRPRYRPVGEVLRRRWLQDDHGDGQAP